MAYLKLIVISFVITQGFSAFAKAHKSECFRNKIPALNVDTNVLKTSREFMEILKNVNWEQEVEGSKVELASLAPDVLSFCSIHYDLAVASAPKNFKDPSIVKASSAANIHEKFISCLKRGAK